MRQGNRATILLSTSSTTFRATLALFLGYFLSFNFHLDEPQFAIFLIDISFWNTFWTIMNRFRSKNPKNYHYHILAFSATCTPPPTKALLEVSAWPKSLAVQKNEARVLWHFSYAKILTADWVTDRFPKIRNRQLLEMS